jgi:hypothetical protein
MKKYVNIFEGKLTTLTYQFIQIVESGVKVKTETFQSRNSTQKEWKRLFVLQFNVKMGEIGPKIGASVDQIVNVVIAYGRGPIMNVKALAGGSK